MKKEKTKRTVWILIAALVLLFFNCTVAEMPDANQAVTMEEPTQEGDVIYEENTENFVNGIDQAYLKERGITEEEFLKEIQAELSQEEGEVFAEAGTRGLPFGANGFFDIDDMIANPSAYFSCNINNSGPNSYVEVGLNKNKLNEMLSRIPEQQLKGTDRIRVYAREFRLNSVTPDTINITSRVQVKLYLSFTIKVGPFKKRVRKNVFDKTYTVHLSLRYHFDNNSKEIVFSKYQTPNISINYNVFNFSLSNLFKKYFQITGNLDHRIPFNFLPTKYLRFKQFYTLREYLFVRLECDKSMLTEVVNFARKLGYDNFTGEAPPLFNTGDRVKLSQEVMIRFSKHVPGLKPFYYDYPEIRNVTKNSPFLERGHDLFTLTRHAKGKFTIGSLGIDSENRLVMNSPYPTVWTVKMQKGGNYTIQSGNNFLSLETESRGQQRDYRVTLKPQSSQWIIQK